MIKNIMKKLANGERLGSLVYIWDKTRAEELLDMVAKATGTTVAEIKSSKSYKNFIYQLDEYADELDY